MPVVLLVPVGLLLLLMVSYATPGMSHAWADALIRGFVNWVVKIPLVGDALAKRITDGASWIAAKIGNLFVRNAGRLINWVGGLGHYVWMIANATLDWPVELVTTLRWLLTKEIPHLIRGLPTAVTRLVHQAQAIIGGLERSIGRLTAHLPGQVRAWIKAGLIGVLGPFILPLRWLLKVWRVVAHAAAHAGGIAIPWIELPKLRRGEIALRKRLSRVEKLLGVTAFAVVMARVLRVSTGCLRDGNIGKTARRLCGLDNLIMDALLADIAFTAGTISVVELAKATQKAAPLVATSLVFFVDDIPIAVKDAEAIGKRALKILESVV